MLYILLSSWPQKLIGLVSSENSLQWLLGFCFWDLTDNCRAMNYFFPNCIILHVLTLKPVYYVFCCPLMKQCVIVLKCTPISWEFPQQKLLTGFWNLEVFLCTPSFKSTRWQQAKWAQLQYSGISIANFSLSRELPIYVWLCIAGLKGYIWVVCLFSQ